MIGPVVVHCGIGLLTAALALPLVARRVPMNRWYGVRIPKAFASSRNWYEINAYGGKLLLAYGLGLTAFGLLLGPLAPPRESPWMAPFIVGPLLVLFLVLARVAAWARRLP